MENLVAIILCILFLSIIIGGALYIDYLFDKYSTSTGGTTWRERRHREG